MAAGSALQVAQLVGRRHAPQVGPLDELQVVTTFNNLLHPVDARQRSAVRVEADRRIQREGWRVLRSRKLGPILVVRDDARGENGHLECFTRVVRAEVFVANNAVLGDADHTVVTHNAKVNLAVNVVRRARVQTKHHGLVRLVAVGRDTSNFVINLRHGAFARGAAVPASAFLRALDVASRGVHAVQGFKIHELKVVRTLDNLLHPASVRQLSVMGPQ